jgi:hypothetical protein
LKKLYLSTDLGQLDLLGEVKGSGNFSTCRQSSEVVPIESYEIRVLNLDALIAAKRPMGRPRELAVAGEPFAGDLLKAFQ